MAWRVGPKVDLTGVVLNLDAANPTSYNGIGSTWYDLSGNGNHFSLTGTTQPSWNGKSVTFNTNGGNQYALCTNTTCGNFGNGSFSIEFVWKYDGPLPVTPTTYAGLIVKRFNYQVTNIQNSNPGIIWNPTANLYIGDGQSAATTGDLLNLLGNATINPQPILPSTGIGYHTLVVQRNGLQITGSLYNNATYLNDNIQYTYTNGGNIDNNVAINLFYAAGENFYMTGSLYTLKMYNRVLSQSEISENYQIYRQYYGF